MKRYIRSNTDSGSNRTAQQIHLELLPHIRSIIDSTYKILELQSELEKNT